MDGARERLAGWQSRGDRALLPLHPIVAAGLGSGAGLRGRDPLILPVGPPRSPESRERHHGRSLARQSPTWQKVPEVAVPGLLEPTEGRKALVSPLRSQAPQVLSLLWGVFVWGEEQGLTGWWG